MAGDTKKEHYVPQVYLRRFCVSPERVNVYDKISNDIRINQPILNVASERYFYDVDLIAYNNELKARGEKSLEELFPGFEKIDPQYIEHMFGSKIEGVYEEKIGKVIDALSNQTEWWINNCFAISEEEKVFFALWASHQLVRTKNFRESISKFQQATAQMMTEYANQNAPDNEKVIMTARTDKTAKQAMHASFILNSDVIAHFAEVLFRHSWIFTVNRSEVPFITSDNPICTIPHDSRIGSPGTGFASSKVEVFFPLSPNIGIMMFEKQLHLEDYDRRSCCCKDSETILQYNYSTLTNASRIIISNSSNLTMYRSFTNEHPEILKSTIRLYHNGKTFDF